MRNVGAQQLAVLIAELDGDVVPRRVDVDEARLGEDGGERQVPLHRARRPRDDGQLLRLHGRRLRAAGGILVVGPPVAVIVHAVVAGLPRGERGGGGGVSAGRLRGERGGGGRRRRGERAYLHGADVAARSLRPGDTPLVRVGRGAAAGGVERRTA